MTLERTLGRLLLAVLGFALLYRLWPVLAGGRPLASFFITEDGYLLLTVARNIALGRGLSVSDGEIATNGVQPLVTFLFTLPYLATGGEKLASLAGIVLISAAVATAGAVAVHRFARAVLAPQDPSPLWPLLVAALWFAGPLLLLHTMNALETGLYTLMALLTLGLFARLAATRARFSPRDQLALGVMCGLVFLTRNDAAFLIFAMLATRLVHEIATRRKGLVDAVLETAPVGVVSIVVASPWLIYNLALFGSVIPISGTAQSYGAEFAANAPLAPVRLFEHMFPMLPVPGGLETVTPLSVALGAVAVAILAAFLWIVTRRRHPLRTAIWAYALFAALLTGYYSLFFGAAHFLSRYLSPLAPLLITAAVAVALEAAGRVAPARRAAIIGLGGAGGAVLCVLLLLRLLTPGAHVHGHFQVVDWVDGNVPEEAWVGAVQTGTLGYWHDRTVNLDGKVNPDALSARIEEGNVLGYVLRSPIDYVADWGGVAGWVDVETSEGVRFGDRFEIVELDREANLAVLRRRGTSPEAAGRGAGTEATAPGS